MRERVYCFACGATHEMETEVDRGALYGRVDCPRRPGDCVLLSSDAELFAAFRKMAPSPAQRRFLFSLIHVTGSCSMRCPNCFAESGGGAPIPVADVLEQMRAAKVAGVRRVSLTGGEPTEHPEIFKIVEAAVKTGLKVSILSNGLNLAKADVASRLRAAGLSSAAISFDTFVPETSVALRGGDYVEAKLRAFEQCSAAGLSVSANVTVFERNVHELGRVFSGLASRFPRLTHVLFQPFRDFGRSQEDAGCLDRERVIHALLESPEFPVDDAAGFGTMPGIPAFGLSVHPDCCAVCAVAARGQGASTRFRLRASPDATQRLRRSFASIRSFPHSLAMLRVALAWGRWVGWRNLPLLRRRVNGGDEDRTVLAVVDNLPHPDYLLADRIERCPSGVVCADGRLAPICAAYRMGKVRLT